VALWIGVCWAVGTAGPQAPELASAYTKAEYMIPMRDGVRLYTQVYSPKDQAGKYPILLTRTPYGVGNYGPGGFRQSLGPSSGFAAEGYIVAYQDVRGKFKSEGEFVHHPPFTDGRKADESSDAYDTIDWLLRNHPNHNGRVGMWGISADGYTTAMGMMNAHPALRAASPQASPGDQFLGDDYHHNGAFRLMYAFSWTSGNARLRTGPTEVAPKPFDYGTPDGYRFFRELGPIANVNARYFQDQVPTWNEFVKHPTYDAYWQAKNVMKDMKDVRFAVLNVIGWFDAEDYHGPWGIYRAIEKFNPSNQSTVVVGPWRHGGWAEPGGEQLGNIRFESKTADYFQTQIELPFFNYYLKDKGPLKLSEAVVFETGSNAWRSYDSWPPKNATARNLYFHEQGKLSFDPPAGPSGADSFVSDPEKPVPFTTRIDTKQGHLWVVEDQRFAASRPDVLVYESDVLDRPVTVAGPIAASLFTSTTGTDADWVVKVIDVFPPDAPDNSPNPANVRMGHFQMMLAGEVFRAKFRNSMTVPEPLVPGRVTHIEFDLLDKNHTFLKGHRIMVQVQSSWFPLIDRNPQTFVDIFRATTADFQKATHTVFRSAAQPSHITVRVVQ